MKKFFFILPYFDPERKYRQKKTKNRIQLGVQFYFWLFSLIRTDCGRFWIENWWRFVEEERFRLILSPGVYYNKGEGTWTSLQVLQEPGEPKHSQPYQEKRFSFGKYYTGLPTKDETLIRILSWINPLSISCSLISTRRKIKGAIGLRRKISAFDRY